MADIIPHQEDSVCFILQCNMFPLLFIPGDTSTGEPQLTPVSYDLKCSEEFGCGAMNVTINVLDKRAVGEQVYGVSVNTGRMRGNPS